MCIRDRVITRRPEEPYTNSVRTVLWEPGRATAPATRAMVALSASGQGPGQDRRVVSRSVALGEGAEGYRSAGLDALAAGAGSEVTILEAVGIAFEAEDLGVMDQPVDHRGRCHVVTEDLTPRRERLVAGDDHRRTFVAAGDEHEHQARGLGVKRDVADLVADQQRASPQAGELFVQLALALRVGPHGNPFAGGAKQDALAGEARTDPQGDAEMCLAGPGRAQQDHVHFGVQEVELAEVFDHLLLDAALEGEVELLEGLVRGEPGGPNPQSAAGGLARGDLGREQRLGEPLIAPFLLPGALDEVRQRPGRGRCLHRPEQMGELGVATHAISWS